MGGQTMNIDRLNEDQLHELNRFLSSFIDSMLHDGKPNKDGIWHTNDNVSPAGLLQARFDFYKIENNTTIKFR